MPYMTVKFKYRKANGSWKVNGKVAHKVYKGHGKRITYIGGKKGIEDLGDQCQEVF